MTYLITPSYRVSFYEFLNCDFSFKTTLDNCGISGNPVALWIFLCFGNFFHVFAVRDCSETHFVINLLCLVS